MNRALVMAVLCCGFIGLSQTRKTVDSINNIAFEKRLANASQLVSVYHKNAADAAKLNYQSGVGESYSNLSLVYNYKGDYDQSVAFALKAISVFEKIGNVQKTAFQYGELGYQMKRRNMPMAQKYMVKAKKLAETHRDTTSLLSIYNNYGVLKEMQQQLDSALFFYRKGLVIKQKRNDVTGIPFSFNNIALVYIMQSRFSDAAELFDKALQMRLAKNDAVGIAENYCYSGDLHAAQNQYADAIVSYEKSLRIAIENKYPHLIQYNYENMALMQSKLGQHKQALESYRLFERVKDSLLNLQTNARIAELEVQFETGKKEKQLIQNKNMLLEEQAESRQKSYLLVLMLVLLTFVGALGFLVYRQQKIKAKQTEQQHKLRQAIASIETQNKLQQQRLDISRDLHDNIGSQLTFIISSVDNLRYAFDLTGTAIERKLSGISDFARDTIIELRDTIWAMNSGEITLESLASRISNFVEKARQADSRIGFGYELPKDIREFTLNASVGMNVYRCVQEAVNNAMKYANATTIKLELSLADALVISVIDDGSGFDINNAASGNGLVNMKRRMEDIGGSFAVASEVGKGTKVTFRIGTPDRNP